MELSRKQDKNARRLHKHSLKNKKYQGVFHADASDFSDVDHAEDKNKCLGGSEIADPKERLDAFI